MEGKSEYDLDLYFAYSDDAWERAARTLAMQFNTTRTQPDDCKSADHFNDSLLGPEGSSIGYEEPPMEWGWAEQACKKPEE